MHKTILTIVFLGMLVLSSSAQEFSFPFTGNTLDSSGNNHHAIMIGNVSPAADRFGMNNRAYHFPGTSSDYLFIHEDWNFPSFAYQWPDSFSVSLWAQPENSGYDGIMLARRDTNWATNHVSDWGLSIGQAIVSSPIGLFYFADGGDYYSSNPQRWYHIVMVYIDSTAKLYVNDTLRYINNYAGIDSMGTGIVIGQYYKGEIDDINFYHQALSPSDVHNLFRMGTATSVEETAEATEVLIYPNPANGQVTVRSNRSGTIGLRLLDVSGRLLQEEKAEASCSLNLSSFNNGVYLLVVTEGDSVTVRKLIVSR